MIKFKSKPSKIEIDLTGPNGNAFYLLAQAKHLCKKLGKDWPDIEKRMTCSDYENLIQVFDREFGEYVDLVR